MITGSDVNKYLEEIKLPISLHTCTKKSSYTSSVVELPMVGTDLQCCGAAYGRNGSVVLRSCLRLERVRSVAELPKVGTDLQCCETAYGWNGSAV